MTSSDRFPVPDRSAVKSNLTDWCFQNLSKRALNALTVQASSKYLSTKLSNNIDVFVIFKWSLTLAIFETIVETTQAIL